MSGRHQSFQNGPLPPVQVRVTQNTKKKTKKSTSCLRTVVEFVLFLVWLLCTGIAGYFVGYDPTSVECPELKQQEQPEKPSTQKIASSACPQSTSHRTSGSAMPFTKSGGFTIDELKAMWQCSHAEADLSEVNKQILPDDMDLKKTKWKSILTVEPKAFFDKYLSQYPKDTRAVQPVVVFSHKPLEKFEELSDVCKVIDIAIVPDKPGVCVAVTETYHDVASYHMLHADRQPDGTFALTGNSLEGRALPSEAAYAAARALLLDFFNFGEKVNADVANLPRFNKGRVVVGSLLEDADDVELFMNSIASARKAGINRNKFVVFTTQQSIKNDMKNTKIKVVYLPYLAEVGTKGDADIGQKLRRHFLQAWLAFAVANSLNKMMWQSPATYWIERPDNVVNAYPAVETLWAYRGRADKRAAPFFVSFDFFVPVGVERPVHLLHELVLHFDLVITWNSIDAVAAYRLSENNSRLVNQSK